MFCPSPIITYIIAPIPTRIPFLLLKSPKVFCLPADLKNMGHTATKTSAKTIDRPTLDAAIDILSWQIASYAASEDFMSSVTVTTAQSLTFEATEDMYRFLGIFR